MSLQAVDLLMFAHIQHLQEMTTSQHQRCHDTGPTYVDFIIECACKDTGAICTPAD